MSNDIPQVGDKVKATLRPERADEWGYESVVRGTVDRIHEDGAWMGKGCFLFDHFTFEILERAKPKWQYGDVALWDNMGDPQIRFYIGGRWLTPGGGKTGGFEHEYKLIMRDGKPV